MSIYERERVTSLTVASAVDNWTVRQGGMFFTYSKAFAIFLQTRTFSAMTAC